MSIESELHHCNGVMRTSALHARGFSMHDLRVAVNRGLITRPGKGWVALSNADSQLLFAATHNSVLTCITQAARLGLWVLQQDRRHIAGSLTARKTSAPNCTVHWRQPLVTRSPGQLADSIENVLDTVAACQPHDAALAIWDSALQKKLIDLPVLETLPLRGNALGLLLECSPYADSGLESMFRTRLRWLQIPIRPQAWAHGHRVDFLLGDRLVVQIDGKQHTGSQRVSDMEHDAALGLRGYTVIRVSYAHMVCQWADVEARILGAIARGQHLAAR